jgi:hypothetical protein
MDSDSERDEAITEQRIAGTSTRALAKRYDCTSREVEEAVDRRFDFELNDRMKLRSVKLDLARIERLFEFFFSIATTGDRDVVAVSAGTLCCKLLERKALFMGTEAPLQGRVDVYQIRPPDAPSSYQRITETLMSLKYGPNAPNGDGATDVPAVPDATNGGSLDPQ